MLTIKQFVREVTPPVFKKAGIYLYKKSFKHNGSPLIKKNKTLEPDKIDPVLFSHSTGRMTFLIPLHKLRYYGGLSYTYEQHHFLQYYQCGPSYLFRFYQKHQPKNIFEKHYLKAPTNRTNLPDGSSFNNPWVYGVPWLFTHDGNSTGDKGLGPEHGAQSFGPISKQKYKMEIIRLDQILKSIKTKGFIPESGSDGYPRGYFLMNSNDDWVFFLGAGLHRVAAMAHLGYDLIPVQFKQNFPRLIKQADSSVWPMVKQGVLSKDEAEKIFMQYMVRNPVVNGAG